MGFFQRLAAWLLGVIGAVGLVSGCASLDFPKRALAVPIFAKESPLASIRAQVWESPNHWYVRGVIQKKHGLHYPHTVKVGVALLNDKGEVMESKTHRIPPTSPSRRLAGRQVFPFVVKFPRSISQQAASVRIMLHWSSDS